MNQIDWSRAPEGYPHWLEGKHKGCSGFVSEELDLYRYPNGSYYPKSEEGKLYSIVRHIVWDGEGLPPVGAMCEIAAGTEYQKVSYPEGTQVKVYANFTDDRGVELAAFVDELGKVGGVATAKCFRPIRTPEQVAAEERENAAKALYATINWNDTPGSWEEIPEQRREDYRKAIDAGYRKAEGGAQ